MLNRSHHVPKQLIINCSISILSVGALEPIFNKLIDLFGTSLTFMLGAIILAIATTIMQKLTPKNTFTPPSNHQQSFTPFPLLILTFMVGFSVGWEFNLIFAVFSGILANQITMLEVGSVIAVLSA